MKKGNHIQKLVAITVLAVYLFATLFSSGFHRHHKGFHHNHSFENKGKLKLLDVTNGISDNDCAVCHFISKKDCHTPLLFNFEFFTTERYSDIKTVDTQDKPFTAFRLFGLRAPPVFI